MRLNELCTALLAVLVLLLLLDSSSAQPEPAQAISKGMVAKKKITDPHYRHQQAYGSYGSSYTAGYEPSYSDSNKYGSDPYKLPYKQGYSNKAYRDAYDDDYYKKPQGYGDDYYSSDSYDSYGGYGKKKRKHKQKNDEVEVSTTIPFTVSACNAKYPGLAQTANTSTADVKTTGVDAWFQLSCNTRPRKHNDDDYGEYDGYGYAEAGSKQQQAAVGVASRYGGGVTGTVENVGQCWFTGSTDSGIAFQQAIHVDNTATGQLRCSITSSEAKECDPGLTPVEGSTVELVATVDVRVKYAGTAYPPTFTIKEVPPLGVIVGFYNGQAGVGSTPVTDLPLRRFNTGIITRLELQECDVLFDPNEVDDMPGDVGQGAFEVKLTI